MVIPQNQALAQHRLAGFIGIEDKAIVGQQQHRRLVAHLSLAQQIEFERLPGQYAADLKCLLEMRDEQPDRAQP